MKHVPQSVSLESLKSKTHLQMNQVFPFPHTGNPMGLASQGFYSEAASRAH